MTIDVAIFDLTRLLITRVLLLLVLLVLLVLGKRLEVSRMKRNEIRESGEVYRGQTIVRRRNRGRMKTIGTTHRLLFILRPRERSIDYLEKQMNSKNLLFLTMKVNITRHVHNDRHEISPMKKTMKIQCQGGKNHS